MLCYSETYQQIADSFAQKHEGWKGARFLGVRKVEFFNSADNTTEWLLFEPNVTDRRGQGLFHFILVNKTQIFHFRDTADHSKEQASYKQPIVLSKAKIVEQKMVVLEDKPIRNTKRLQAIADEYATKHGYCAASYNGYYYGYAVYSGLYLSCSILQPTGAPAFILVSKTGQVRYVCDFEDGYMGAFDIIDKINNNMPWKRGERVYKMLMAKYENHECKKSERAYLEYLYSLDLLHWNNSDEWQIDKQAVFTYLEAANRIGDEIIIIKDVDSGVQTLAFKNTSNYL